MGELSYFPKSQVLKQYIILLKFIDQFSYALFFQLFSRIGVAYQSVASQNFDLSGCKNQDNFFNFCLKDNKQWTASCIKYVNCNIFFNVV